MKPILTMKTREKKPEIVYRIIERETGNAIGSYSRAYCEEYDFESVEQARTANCYGMFEDKKKYKIAKYRVTYELIEDDVPSQYEDANPATITMFGIPNYAIEQELGFWPTEIDLVLARALAVSEKAKAQMKPRKRNR